MALQFGVPVYSSRYSILQTHTDNSTLFTSFHSVMFTSWSWMTIDLVSNIDLSSICWELKRNMTWHNLAEGTSNKLHVVQKHFSRKRTFSRQQTGNWIFIASRLHRRTLSVWRSIHTSCNTYVEVCVGLLTDVIN